MEMLVQHGWVPPATFQDVDSRERRRRELEPPKQPEPQERLEPSTSWWPVSSAEKKKNITLVRVGACWQPEAVVACDGCCGAWNFGNGGWILGK